MIKIKYTKTIAVLVATALLFLISGNDINAQRLKPGPQDLSFFSKVDETDQPYAIYIPKNFDETRKYPLVVFLHGAWSNHRLGLRRAFGQGNLQGTDVTSQGNVTRENDLEASRYFPKLKDVGYIVAAPYARGTAGYQGIPEQDVYEMLDNFIPGTLTTIDAKFTGVNSVEVTTGNLDAVTLNLAGHPQFNPGQKLTVKIDGKSFSIKTGDAASFMKVNGNWTNRKFAPQLTLKKPGAEGPLYAAVSSNHIYVFGTGGNPSREELAARRAQAASAADWSGMGGRIMVFPRALSDKELRESDYDNCNIILFGTRETNLIIERLAGKLPVHLNNDAKDYGLVYIYPLNDHYVLVNSGLPWWTTPKSASRQGGMAFMGSGIELLKTFGDFILFKDTPDNIITKGHFDNNWKLPADAVSAMKISGVTGIK